MDNPQSVAALLTIASVSQIDNPVNVVVEYYRILDALADEEKRRREAGNSQW